MRKPFWNRNTRWVALGLALSAAGGLGLVALASAHDGPGPGMVQARSGPPMPGGPAMMPGMPLLGGPMAQPLLDDLKATPEQRAAIERIRAQLREDLRIDPAVMQAERDRWLALLSAPQVDAAAVEALRAKGEARQAEVSRKTTQALVAASQVLTPAQRAQFGKLATERGLRPAMEHRPGGPGGHGGPRQRPDDAPGT